MKGYFHGNLKTYWENGTLRRDEIYEKDKLLNGKCFDTAGKDEYCEEYVKNPEFPGGDAEFSDFIHNEFIKNIKGTERIPGTVLVTFCIGPDGVVKNVRILESVAPENDNAVLLVLSKMPKWKPCYKDGEATEVSMVLPFQLIVK